MDYYSKEEVLEAEHDTLCDLVLGEGTGDFILGEVCGILHFTSNLFNAKKEGDG